MAFFGIFGKSNPSKKAIARQVKRVKQRYSKSEDRHMAMDKLLKWNTFDSIYGVLARFTIVAQSPHWDEEEKNWLSDELVKKGTLAKEAIVSYMKQAREVTHVISCLKRLCDEEEVITILLDSLAARQPQDYLTSQSKTEIIAALGEFADDTRIEEAIIPYLYDHDDDVQCIVIDVALKNNYTKAHATFLKMITEDEFSPRVLRQVAQAVCDLKLSVAQTQDLVEIVLEDFSIKEGLLVSNR